VLGMHIPRLRNMLGSAYPSSIETYSITKNGALNLELLSNWTIG